MDAKPTSAPAVTPDPKTQPTDAESDASTVDDPQSERGGPDVGGPAAALGSGVEAGLEATGSGDDAGPGSPPGIGAERDDAER